MCWSLISILVILRAGKSGGTYCSWWQGLFNNPDKSKLGGWGWSRRSRRAKFSQHSLGARREKLSWTCKVPNTMIRKKDTDHMVITALVLREWSKAEVPATPTSQTRCPVFLISHTYLKVSLVLQDILTIPTSPSLPSRTSGNPTDPSSAPPSLNPQTQLNWIRSDQNVVWPWSFLIMIVVENIFLEDDSSQKSAIHSSVSCYIFNIIYKYIFSVRTPVGNAVRLGSANVQGPATSSQASLTKTFSMITCHKKI